MSECGSSGARLSLRNGARKKECGLRPRMFTSRATQLQDVLDAKGRLWNRSKLFFAPGKAIWNRNVYFFGDVKQLALIISSKF